MHHDAYFTPPEMTVALMERQKFRGVVWEPACGAGNMSEVVNRYGLPVVSSDVFNYGFPGTIRHDFLTDRPTWWFDSVVTNPPYSGKVIRPWIKRACALNPERLALLLPVNGFADFIEPGLMGKMRLRRIIVFDRRRKSGATLKFKHANGNYFAHRWPSCWFVAEYGYKGGPDHETVTV